MALRFPPSPTGLMHIGNLRVAVINYLYAKKYNLKYILRFDDTDQERSTEEYKQEIKNCLKSMDIAFDEEYSQSQRLDVYREVFEKLKTAGYIYECYETEEELDYKRKRLLSMGRAPVYDRHSLNLSQEQIKKYKGEGRGNYYRFKLDSKEEVWQDLVQGKLSYKTASISDPVILRKNGNFMYTFCSMVDDIKMGVTHIIRGADHITNNAVQLQIAKSIKTLDDYKDVTIPKTGHLPLFQSKEGKISKRKGSSSIKDYQERGIFNDVIFNIAAKLGMDSVNTIETKEEIIKNFDLESFGKSSLIFDEDLLDKNNIAYLRQIDYQTAKDIGLNDKINEEFYIDIQENIETLDDYINWYEILKSETIEEKIKKAKEMFTSDDLEIINTLEEVIKNHNTWSEILPKLKEKLPNIKGKKLFMPIRIALTGREKGPNFDVIFKSLVRT